MAIVIWPPSRSEQVRDHRGRALVRNVRRLLDTADGEQALAVEIRKLLPRAPGARCLRGVAIGDELAHAVHRQLARDGDHRRRDAELRHRQQRGRRIGRQDTGVVLQEQQRRDLQQHRVAVGRRLDDTLRGNQAIGAALVLDDRRLTPGRGHARREEAGCGIEAAARCGRNDQRDAMRGIVGLRRCEWRGRRRQRRGEQGGGDRAPSARGFLHTVDSLSRPTAGACDRRGGSLRWPGFP
jgi:hypothetical protein